MLELLAKFAPCFEGTFELEQTYHGKYMKLMVHLLLELIWSAYFSCLRFKPDCMSVNGRHRIKSTLLIGIVGSILARTAYNCKTDGLHQNSLAKSVYETRVQN